MRWGLVFVAIALSGFTLLSFFESMPGEPDLETHPAPSFRVELEAPPESATSETELLRQANWRTGSRFEARVTQSMDELHGFTAITIYATIEASDWACVPNYAARATWVDGKSSMSGASLAGMQRFRDHSLVSTPAFNDGRDWRYQITLYPAAELSAEVEKLLTSGRDDTPTSTDFESLAGVECKQVPASAEVPTAAEIARDLPGVLAEFRLQDPYPLIDEQVREIQVPSVEVRQRGANRSTVDIVLPPNWLHLQGDVGGLESYASGFRTPEETSQFDSGYQSWSIIVEDQFASERVEQTAASLQTLAGLWIGLVISAGVAVPLTTEVWGRKRRGKHAAL